jgi:hypothetical protein
VTRNYGRFRRTSETETEGDRAAVPAAKIFAYAIEVAGCVRPVLTVSGSEAHRAEWIARAIAIAEQARTGTEDPLVWEAEIGPGGVDEAAFALIHPEMTGAGGTSTAARSGVSR